MVRGTPRTSCPDSCGRPRLRDGYGRGAISGQLLSRLTVHRVEQGEIDPKLSTLLEMVRALGMELLLVPAVLRPELEAFVRAGGRLLGQPEGASAPRSIVTALLEEGARRGER